MTSRLTVNNIESNSGISSIALDTGVTIETGSGLNVSGIVTATTITGAHTGDASQLTAIPGANITGTIPAAALTNVDLTSIRKDISILSLQTAVDTNRVAYNLANSFVDQFENDTGIGASTTVQRETTDEHFSTAVATWGSEVEYTHNSSPALALARVTAINATGSDQLSNVLDGATNDWGLYIAGPSNFNSGWSYDIGADSNFGAGFKLTKVTWWNHSTSARFKDWRLEISSDGSSYSVTNIGGAVKLTAGNSEAWNTGTLDTEWEIPNASSKFKVTYDGHYNNGNTNCGLSEIKLSGKPKTLTYNATGNVVSKANTASDARTKVSGVMLYKDASGTATLGTDLKVSFTCNGGTNWTALSSGSDYTLASDFSTGVKTVYLAEKTCTSGTDIRYKIEWANQSNGSKVTQVHGMAINY